MAIFIGKINSYGDINLGLTSWFLTGMSLFQNFFTDSVGGGALSFHNESCTQCP